MTEIEELEAQPVATPVARDVAVLDEARQDAIHGRAGELEGPCMVMTRPDLAPFRAKVNRAHQRIAAYAGEDNVNRFRAMVEHRRTA
jgi:hypothetical protein